MHVKKSKMGFRQGVEEISLSKEAREDCNRSSVNERINVNSDMTGFSSATVSHRFATLTADLEAKNDQIGDEMHESDGSGFHIMLFVFLLYCGFIVYKLNNRYHEI